MEIPALTVLADPTRVRIVQLIRQADDGRTLVGRLAEQLNLRQPTVSHHTKVLTEAGLITGEKRGRWMWWSVVPERLAELRSSLSA